MTPKLTYKIRFDIDNQKCIAPFINGKNVWDIPVKYWSEPVQASIINAYELGYAHAEEIILEAFKHNQPYSVHTSFKKKMTKEEAKKVLELLEHLKALNEVTKILNTFIPAFKNKHIIRDGWHYLTGNFNLGSVKSGRLSSSKPNLQQIPSTGTSYAKTIKKCFKLFKNKRGYSPWLFCGADFWSLEDRISALTTKDPNKLLPYTDGYDGHCLRAYAYFKDQMPDIEPTLKSINSIETQYPELRQESKTPTFALTYRGTWRTLVQNSGFTEEKAKKIEKEYHRLYAIADKWVMDRLIQASKDGYVTLAFGLLLRTPMLKQVIITSPDSMPYEANKEMKTAGNALGQSYGLLNTRAANEFMERVWASKWNQDILPTAQIHDAQYYMIKNDIECVHWVNENLIECMSWNELPELQHDTVKLGANLEIYYPTWADAIKIPNHATQTEITEILNAH